MADLQSIEAEIEISNNTLKFTKQELESYELIYSLYEQDVKREEHLSKTQSGSQKQLDVSKQSMARSLTVLLTKRLYIENHKNIIIQLKR